MEEITKLQYDALMAYVIHPSLPENVKSDIDCVKSVLLTTQNGKYFLDYIEFEELCEEEIREIKAAGTVVTFK